MTLKSYNVSPPGNWRYRHPEPESNGHVSTGITFGQLIQNAEQHRANMHYPEDTELADAIEVAICESLEPDDQREYCIDAPPKPWPLFLQPFKLLAQPGDRGLGDIITRTIGPAGGEAYEAWFLKTFGKTCGCKKRSARLNRLYPLP